MKGAAGNVKPANIGLTSGPPGDTQVPHLPSADLHLFIYAPLERERKQRCDEHYDPNHLITPEPIYHGV